MPSQRFFVLKGVAVTDPGQVPDLCIEGGRILKNSFSLIAAGISQATMSHVLHKVFNANFPSPRLEKVSWNAGWDHISEVDVSST